MVPVRPGDDETDRMQFTQLILDIVKSEAGHVRHLSHISRLLWFDQKQLQKSGISHPETEYPEPSSQNSLPFLKLDGFKPSSSCGIREEVPFSGRIFRQRVKGRCVCLLVRWR